MRGLGRYVERGLKVKRELASRHSTTRRMRLKGFDYRIPGYCFITICQHDRHHLFSRVNNGALLLLPAGDMIASSIDQISRRFPETQVDTSVIMPNHVHLLLGMNLSENTATPNSVIEVLNWWKSITTTRYITGVKEMNWRRFLGSLWQEGYHDRIVRDQRELEMLRYYIEQNPKRWDEDTFFDDNVAFH